MPSEPTYHNFVREDMFSVVCIAEPYGPYLLHKIGSRVNSVIPGKKRALDGAVALPAGTWNELCVRTHKSQQ